MAPAAWLVLVPVAHASLLSGIAISLGTPWGLFRRYWVVVKLAITLFSTVTTHDLYGYMGTFRQMAGVAADPLVEFELVRNASPMVHAILALILLMIATVLGVYKPSARRRMEGARWPSDVKQPSPSPPRPETAFLPRSRGTFMWAARRRCSRNHRAAACSCTEQP